MKKKTLVMVMASICTSPLYAAAFDRSGQSISAFLQPGNYFEGGITVLDTSLEGQEAGTNPTRNSISDIINSAYNPSAALKLQLTPQFSFGFIYDQPYASDSEYTGNNSFVAKPNDTVLVPGINSTTLAEKTGGEVVTGNTKASFDMQSFSFIGGYQPNKYWNLYAGPVYQTFKSNVNLRGQVFGLYNGYDFEAKEVGDWGWLAGFAYQIPEKAIKASLTYRSSIHHEVKANEKLSLVDMLSTQQGRDFLDEHLAYMVSIGQMTEASRVALNHVVANLPDAGKSGTTKFKSPESVNLEFQTGLRKGTLLFGNLRWVHWSDFEFKPYHFGEISEVVGALSTPSRPNGFNLVRYYDDQWSANLGIGQRLSDKWSGSVSIGWDSGAGERVSTGGPNKGYYSVGLGAQYSPTTKYFISGGLKYLWLGDAKGQLGAQAGSEYYVGEYKNNYSIGYGLKIGYKF